MSLRGNLPSHLKLPCQSLSLAASAATEPCCHRTPKAGGCNMQRSAARIANHMHASDCVPPLSSGQYRPCELRKITPSPQSAGAPPEQPRTSRNFLQAPTAPCGPIYRGARNGGNWRRAASTGQLWPERTPSSLRAKRGGQTARMRKWGTMRKFHARLTALPGDGCEPVHRLRFRPRGYPLWMKQLCAP